MYFENVTPMCHLCLWLCSHVSRQLVVHKLGFPPSHSFVMNPLCFPSLCLISFPCQLWGFFVCLFMLFFSFGVFDYPALAYTFCSLSSFYIKGHQYSSSCLLSSAPESWHLGDHNFITMCIIIQKSKLHIWKQIKSGIMYLWYNLWFKPFP